MGRTTMPRMASSLVASILPGAPPHTRKTKNATSTGTRRWVPSADVGSVLLAGRVRLLLRAAAGLGAAGLALGRARLAARRVLLLAAAAHLIAGLVRGAAPHERQRGDARQG